MTVQPFIAQDMEAIELQPVQKVEAASLTVEDYRIREQCESYTLLDGDLVVACVGLEPIWSDRAWVWSFLSVHAKDYMITVTRIIKELLALSPFRLIEAYTQHDFTQGHRWLRMLGFEQINPRVRNWLPGVDCAIYLRNTS